MLRAAGKEGERVRDRVSRAPPREKGAVRQKTPGTSESWALPLQPLSCLVVAQRCRHPESIRP
eukprot:scaffold4664_cov146-Pinguiococcus_pyrenoidosus.AAC.2